MPKLKFEFNLPEEREEYEICSNAMSYYCAISDFANWLRSQLKYSNREEGELKLLEEVREAYFHALDDNGVNNY